MFGLPLSRLLVASIIASLIGIGGVMMTPQKDTHLASIEINSERNTYSVGDTFVTTVDVSSTEPVNVFGGLITFDTNRLQVSKIEYNTSFADLWAEEPWYSNGEGTVSFVGGTTQPDGFTGEETLFTITFTAISVGDTTLSIEGVRIFKHDGLGNDAMTAEPIDSIFSIVDLPPEIKIIPSSNSKKQTLQVLPEHISTDLNHDGQQSIIDVSIFMKHLATGNLDSDFNQDEKVDLSDLSILMN